MKAAALAQYRQAGRIVTAVLEPSQTLQQDRHDIALRDDSDDSAHALGSAIQAIDSVD